MKPTILLDVDGVVVNFVGPALDKINNLLGTTHAPRDVTQWDIMSALDVPPEVAEEVDRQIKQAGFCASLAAYKGALDGVAELRKLGRVKAVTSPYSSVHWECEREAWLLEAGFERKDIVFTHAKHKFAGDIIIDDKTTTLVRWHAEQKGHAILYSQPWNSKDTWGLDSRQSRIKGWDYLVRECEHILEAL